MGRQFFIRVGLPSAMALAAMLVAANRPASAQNDAEAQSVRVVNVSRGDVIRIEDGGPERVVMLYGVTCPDPHTPVGARAKAFTENQIGGSEVTATVRFRQPSVDYVEVRLGDGRVLNHQLLLAGLGRLDTLSAGGDEAYAALQEQAQTAGAGVWTREPEEAGGDGVVTEVIAVRDPEELPVERFKRVKELQAEVDFAVALEHWRNLSDEQKAEIQGSLQQRVETQTVRAEEDVEASLEELNAVGRELAEVEAQIEAKQVELEELGPLAEEEAVLDLYAEDPELVRLERDLSDARAATEIAIDRYGGNSTTYYRTMEDEDIAEQLVIERRQLLAVEEQRLRNQFAARRNLVAQELELLQEGYAEIQRRYDALATDYNRAVAGVETRTARGDVRLTQLQRLQQAEEAGFDANLKTQQIGIWRGTGPSETPAFDVTRDVWVLDYDAGPDAGNGELQISVLRESDNAVIRQIIDRTLPHRSFETLTEQGGIYLRIGAPEDLSWTITATGYARE